MFLGCGGTEIVQLQEAIPAVCREQATQCSFSEPQWECRGSLFLPEELCSQHWSRALEWGTGLK